MWKRSPCSRLGGLGELTTATNEFWNILELERTHLIATNLTRLTFLLHIYLDTLLLIIILEYARRQQYNYNYNEGI